MKVSSRELLLGWITLVVLVGSLTYGFLQPRLREWADLGKQRQLVRGRHALAQRLLEQKPGLDERMEALRRKVPSYSADKDVTSDYLKLIEQLAKESGVSLIQRRPDREKIPKQGRLYELAMDCTWESDLASLLRFMVAIEAQDRVVMDVRDLTVSPIPGKTGRLKGNVVLIGMYTRSEDSVKNASAVPHPAESATGPARLSAHGMAPQSKPSTSAGVSSSAPPVTAPAPGRLDPGLALE